MSNVDRNAKVPSSLTGVCRCLYKYNQPRLAVWLTQNNILVLQISNLKLVWRVEGFWNTPGSIFHVNGALLLQSILFMHAVLTQTY